MKCLVGGNDFLSKKVVIFFCGGELFCSELLMVILDFIYGELKNELQFLIFLMISI
jgi:hypothetical protein